MFEFLVSEGHREPDLWEHSGEKIELLYELAIKRNGRESALVNIGMMQVIQAAVASVACKEGQQVFKAVMKDLQKMAGFQPDIKETRAALKKQLAAIGAKTQ